MPEREPNLVTSSLSQTISRSGVTVEVQIYKLEGGAEWTLEVVNEKGTSTVWDDGFASDDAAYATFLTAVREEGVATFLDQATVIPFRRLGPQASTSHGSVDWLCKDPCPGIGLVVEQLVPGQVCHSLGLELRKCARHHYCGDRLHLGLPSSDDPDMTLGDLCRLDRIIGHVDEDAATATRRVQRADVLAELCEVGAHGIMGPEALNSDPHQLVCGLDRHPEHLLLRTFDRATRRCPIGNE